MFREPLPTLDNFQTLPGFRWTGPETKVDPDTQLALDFLVWCRGKPAGEEYDFCDADHCAVAQFGIETGLPQLVGEANARAFGPMIYDALDIYAFPGSQSWTFGQLADRLESSLSRMGRG